MALFLRGNFVKDADIDVAVSGNAEELVDLKVEHAPGQTSEEHIIQEKIQQMVKATGVCSPGYLWRKVEGGYRCAGEGHFMSNEELGIEEPKSEEASQTLLKEQEAEEAEQVDQEEETQERIQERLKATRVCAAGYRWTKVEGGYRCAGGSHFLSNEELDLIEDMEKEEESLPAS